jgi:L-fuconate dehydratase
MFKQFMQVGGLGVCKLVDYIAVGGDLDERVVEYVGELHEHFVDPVRILNGRYVAPEAPGYSIEMHRESLAEYAFPDGAAWQTRQTGSGTPTAPR